MFSLLRCLFWLGVVFSQIAAREGMDTAALVRQVPLSASHRGGGPARSATQDMVGTALDEASKKCAAAPDSCLTLARGLTGIGVAASRDSLNTSDRLPAWRPRTGKLDDGNASR
jgi:hypothetical protein